MVTSRKNRVGHHSRLDAVRPVGTQSLYWLAAGEVGLFCFCMGGLMYYKCALPVQSHAYVGGCRSVFCAVSRLHEAARLPLRKISDVLVCK